MNGTVSALFVKPFRGAKAVSIPSVEVQPMGFEGDYHTGSSKRRQVLLMSASILKELDIAPGAVSENVVVDGFDVMTLKEGQLVRIGAAAFEVTVPCEPCVQMDRVRRGLKETLVDRRGIFVRVLETGVVRVGDAVDV